MAVAGAAALAASALLLNAYLQFQRATGFVRPLSASGGFSANWQAYLASPAFAHSWLLRWLGSWNEVLFPGWVAAIFAALTLGSTLSISGRLRETRPRPHRQASWLSGPHSPAAGLYQVLYDVFARSLSCARRVDSVWSSFWRCLCWLVWASRRARTTFSCSPWATAALMVIVLAEHLVPLDFRPIAPVELGTGSSPRCRMGPSSKCRSTQNAPSSCGRATCWHRPRIGCRS